jgi:hypothetical protein
MTQQLKCILDTFERLQTEQPVPSVNTRKTGNTAHIGKLRQADRHYPRRQSKGKKK